MAARKKPRTAAQKAATRKMIAANRKRRAPVRRAPARRAAPKRRRRAPAAASAAPRRRRAAPRRRAHRISSQRAASHAGRVLRYRRPNPIDGLVDNLTTSAVGVGGALLLDVALGLVPLPAALTTGMMGPVVKVAGAVGLGMLGSKLLGRKRGNELAVGALTVNLYQIVRPLLAGKVPGLSGYVDGYELLPDGTVGYISSGQQVGEYVGDDSMAGFETGVYR